MNDLSPFARDRILSINYPEDGKLRARKVVSRSKGRPSGKYPSWKMGRMVHWESSYELNAYRLLDANPAVASFWEQPLVIRFILDGEEHRHYPDTLVHIGSTQELWEIKPASEAFSPKIIARTQLLQAALPEKGFTYRMVIGEELAREPRLSTVLTLLKYGRQSISLTEHEQVRQILEKSGAIPWGTAVTEVLGKRGRFILARLALEGFVEVDFESSLRPETLFTSTTRSALGT